MNIYVGNLSYETTENELKELFEAFGKVETARIIKDNYTNRSKGFGFVEMNDNAEAQAAIDGLNDKEVQGKTLKVNTARPKTDNRRSGGGYGGAGRSGRQDFGGRGGSERGGRKGSGGGGRRW
ncbi:MAG: RNA-binding protein [Deltaproteobacteria bacterium]|nr:RNA-binding protein [Deltaproteobacteria bacterium]